MFRGHLARFSRLTGVGFGLKYPTNRGGLEAFDEAISEQEWGLITTKLQTLVVLKIKKDLNLSKSLISFSFLAPRPGLEPGTYGLTVRRSTD